MDSLFLRLNLALIVNALNVLIWTAVDSLFLRLNLTLIVDALICQSGLLWILCS